MPDAHPTGSDRTAPLATATAVSCAFGGFLAVDRVDIAVRPGEIVGLLGGNGAGKTTLIRLLLGLQRPSAGSVALFGGPPTRAGRTRLGYVAQGLGLYQDLTVAENAAFVSHGYHAPAVELDAELARVADQPAGRIGLGRQRQLAFAAALSHRPELLILDEPSSGVDPLSRARLWDRIHQQAELGVGVLITTHYLQEAQQCDRLVIMADGRIAAEGALDDIIGDHRATYVHSADWSRAFTALLDDRAAVTLSGTDIRVADRTVSSVRDCLARASIDAVVTDVPATLEETMVTLARAQ
jgi:ABC-2 type transport system ATP-binding protein/ribosome-dependent ATPase